MVKKELTNKKVVRAIALGLSAVMLTTPITAHAETATEGGEGNTTPEPKEINLNVEQTTPVTDTADAIDNARDTILNKEPGDNVVIDTPDPEVPDSEGIDVVLPSKGVTIKNTPDAVEAAGNTNLSDVKTTVGEGENAEEITYADVIGEAVEATETTEEKNTGLLGADDDLQDANNALAGFEPAKANANEAIGEAEETIGEINANNDAVAKANVAAQAAAEKADEALKEAQAATTPAAAQVAANKAEEAFKEATAAQAAAQNAYDANAEKLAEAEEELATALAALNAAKAAKETTVNELAAAHAAVSAAADNAAALKAQVDADAKALADSEENALKVAYDNMMAQSVSNRYSGGSATATDADKDGIGDEFTTEFGSESASSAYWAAADIYFELYLKYIYGDNYVSGEWQKNNSTLDNPQTAYDAEVDNTFIVKYLDDNGVEQTAYYNYHTALDKDIDGDGVLDVKKGDITIYEKQKATGKTEEVWGTETEEFEDTKLVEKTRTEQQEMSETTSEDALSIDNGDGTYTKLSDVQEDGDVVLTTESDTEGNATSVLVKDDNSQLLDSQETALAQNQKVVEGTSEDSYGVGTIQVPASYGTKEVEEKWVDCISTYDELEDEYEELLKDYPQEDGYVIRLYRHHLFGDMEEIDWDEAEDFWNQFGAGIFGGADRGYEIGVYKVVEDTSKVTGWADQQVIVKTTTATVETTTPQRKVSDKWYDKEWQAREAGHAYAQNVLGLKEGEYTVKTDDDGWFFDYDYEYIIYYNTTSSVSQTIKTETYSATAYNTNTIETTRTWMEDVTVTYEEEETFTNTREIDVLLKESVEYEYWTERRNTSNDDEVKAAIEDIEKVLDDYADKKDAAAVALAAALQAKADVEKAQAELSEVEEVDYTAYRKALEKYNAAYVAYEEAKSDLEEAKQAAEDAEQDYADAAAELGRFVNVGGEGDSDSDDDDDTTPVVTPVPTPVVLADTPVAPVAVAAVAPTAGAAPAVVNIDDEATPLAGGIGNDDGNAGNGDDEVIVAGAEEEVEPAIVAIEDEETPLAAGVGADGKMSWWWLLIVALLGATGYKMYKDHQKKKEEAQEA